MARRAGRLGLLAPVAALDGGSSDSVPVVGVAVVGVAVVGVAVVGVAVVGAAVVGAAVVGAAVVGVAVVGVAVVGVAVVGVAVVGVDPEALAIGALCGDTGLTDVAVDGAAPGGCEGDVSAELPSDGLVLSTAPVPVHGRAPEGA